MSAKQSEYPCICFYCGEQIESDGHFAAHFRVFDSCRRAAQTAFNIHQSGHNKDYAMTLAKASTRKDNPCSL